MADLPSRLAAATAHRRGALTVGFILGVFAALGQAPFELFPATLLGLFGGYGLVRMSQSPWRAALAGWGFGAGYFSFTLIWIVQPFMVDVARYGWMAPFALFSMAGGLALFWSFGFGVARWLAPKRWAWLAWAVMMSAVELTRGVIFTGFPWGGPGAVWVNTPILQLGAFIGANGLTFLTFLCASAAFALWSEPGKVRNSAVLLGGVVLVVTIGLVRGAGDIPPDENPKMLRLVQPNAAQHLKWNPDYAPLFLDRQIELTALAPEPGNPPPDLIVWPETSIPYLLGRAPRLMEEIARSAGGAMVVVGVQRNEGARYYNALAVLDGAGSVQAVYDKHHLVPFGEYTPGGDFLSRFGLRAFAARFGNGYSAGPGAAVLDLGALGKILPLICYEAIFPGDLRAAPQRADMILQITNDAWFGTFSGPQQHLVQAQLRAVEQGLPFIRAANTGISAVINARGRIVARLPMGVSGKLDAPLPAALPATPYSRLGDAPLILFLILFLGTFLLSRARNSD